MVIGQQLGRAIKERRLNLGQTQEQAAAAISGYADEPITKVSVSEWERGKSAPHPRNIGPLAKWMGQSVARVAMMAEDAELPAGQRDEDLAAKVLELTERLAGIEAQVQALAARNVEQQQEITQLAFAVIESLAKRIGN